MQRKETKHRDNPPEQATGVATLAFTSGVVPQGSVILQGNESSANFRPPIETLIPDPRPVAEKGNRVKNSEETDGSVLVVSTLSELHHPQSKRLDVNRFAQFFAIRAEDFVSALQTTPEKLRKQPDAPDFQPYLVATEHLLTSLFRDLGRAEDVKEWLHLPDRQLRHQTPLALILSGKVGILQRLRENSHRGEFS